jgi:hypothetical protein
VADHIADDGSGNAQAERVAAQIYDETGDVRQRPRWLALIKEPPMRVSSQVAVGSPTVRVAAIMVATLLLALMVAGAGIAGSRLLAADGTIVVDPSGDGTTTTIAAAVEIAEDGDTILLKPGTYTEAIIIDKDITLIGDGADASEVVVHIPEDGPRADWLAMKYAFWLQDADASLSKLTIHGPGSRVSAFVVVGGDPTIHDIVVDLDEYVVWPYGFVYIRGDATGTIRDNVADGFVWIDDEASPLFEGNVINNVIRNDGDSDATIVGNELGGVWAQGGAAPTIEDNLIDFDDDGSADGFGSCGVEISGLASPTVASNVIRNAPTGICARSGASGGTSATIEDNELLDNGVGIFVRSDAHIEGNLIEGGAAGIVISRGSPSLIDNSVEGASRIGITISSDTSPILSGNTSCDNGTNLTIDEGATPDIDDTNVFCEDVLAEPSE